MTGIQCLSELQVTSIAQTIRVAEGRMWVQKMPGTDEKSKLLEE